MGDPYQTFAAEEESEPVNDLSSQLQLCMQWTKPHSLLEAPTLDALACIKGSIEPGDEKVRLCVAVYRHNYWHPITCFCRRPRSRLLHFYPLHRCLPMICG